MQTVRIYHSNVKFICVNIVFKYTRDMKQQISLTLSLSLSLSLSQSYVTCKSASKSQVLLTQAYHSTPISLEWLRSTYKSCCVRLISYCLILNDILFNLQSRLSTCMWNVANCIIRHRNYILIFKLPYRIWTKLYSTLMVFVITSMHNFYVH